MGKIKYKLYPNLLTNDADKYRAVMDLNKTSDLKDLINFMSFRHSSITTADMMAFIEDFNQAIVRMLLDGKRVNTELLIFSMSIKGNFNGSDDQFDPSRHELAIRIRPTRAFKEKLKIEASMEKQRAVAPRPVLDRYYNLHQGDPDTVLSPTHTGRIKGHNLSFDQTDDQQGLFILPANGNGLLTNGDVRVAEISLVTSGQVIFRVPEDLPPGSYRLEVRARRGTSDLRSGILKDTLLVL
jgi:hypothetical protein